MMAKTLLTLGKGSMVRMLLLIARNMFLKHLYAGKNHNADGFYTFFVDFSSCLKPNLLVHVAKTSSIAGMTGFSTPKSLKTLPPPLPEKENSKPTMEIGCDASGKMINDDLYSNSDANSSTQLQQQIAVISSEQLDIEEYAAL